MVFNPYAAGSKVYRSGVSAPTHGTVDPTGYVVRERLKRAMAPSESRSGLASNLLDRSGGGPMSMTAGKGDRRGDRRRGGKKRPRRRDPGGGTKKKPFILVTPNGKLNLPWDMEHQLQGIAAKNRLDQQLNSMQRDRQDYMQQYRDTLANSEFNYNQAQNQILDADAGRGMAFSSGHAQNMYNAGTEYNNFLQGMESDKTSFLGDYQSAKQDARRNFIQQLANMSLDQGLGLEQFAGTLGYGQQRHKQPKNTNKAPKKRRKPGDKKPNRRRRRDDDKARDRRRRHRRTEGNKDQRRRRRRRRRRD